MAAVSFGRADYNRTVAREARIQTLNRYYESNPVLTAGGTALISRAGLRRYLTVGDGPIRATYTSPGSFLESLFVVSDNSWYRVRLDNSIELLSDGLNGGAAISMAATGNIDSVPEYLFMADGRNLWLYIENGYAHGTYSGSSANGDVIGIVGGATTYYQFTNGSVDAGAPDGSQAHPWLVALGNTDNGSLENLADAITATGTKGTTYSSALANANPDVKLQSINGTELTVSSTAIGALGNDTQTSSTSAGAHWAAAALTGGGQDSVTQVETPDGIGAISVGYIAGFIVVIPVQGAGINGRFWWIEPGETTIDPLNYATAERAPDPVYQVVIFGDQFWLPGESTTEVWFFTGDLSAPVQRMQGVTFDRGTWEGTALQVKESMIIVDHDGGVFQISGGLDRISTPPIEQRIREAIQYQAAQGV